MNYITPKKIEVEGMAGAEPRFIIQDMIDLAFETKCDVFCTAFRRYFEVDEWSTVEWTMQKYFPEMMKEG